MGGLLVATVLTILFLPALYALCFRRSLDTSGAEAPPQESKIVMWIRKMAQRATAAMRGVLPRPRAHAAVLMAALVLAAMAGGALAAEQGTAAERRACMPDAIRHCGDLIPDVRRIVACLRAKLPELTAECRIVMAGPAETEHVDVARRQ
jgi:hypothetical protein